VPPLLQAIAATTSAPVIHPIVLPGCQLFVMASGPGYLGAFPTAIGKSSASAASLANEFVVSGRAPRPC
jgi:hypothetical protein